VRLYLNIIYDPYYISQVIPKVTYPDLATTFYNFFKGVYRRDEFYKQVIDTAVAPQTQVGLFTIFAVFSTGAVDVERKMTQKASLSG
jgi:hypothetical protein